MESLPSLDVLDVLGKRNRVDGEEDEKDVDDKDVEQESTDRILDGLSQLIVASYNTAGKYCEAMPLYIHKIDDMPCQVDLAIDELPRCMKIRFMTKTNRWLGEHYISVGSNMVTNESIKHALVKVVKHFNQGIVFDPVFGRFETKAWYERNQYLREFSALTKLGRTEENFTQCSVCYLRTESKTPCKHYLCCRCWYQPMLLCCPICRHPLNNDESDDNESDDE